MKYALLSVPMITINLYIYIILILGHIIITVCYDESRLWTPWCYHNIWPQSDWLYHYNTNQRTAYITKWYPLLYQTQPKYGNICNIGPNMPQRFLPHPFPQDEMPTMRSQKRPDPMVKNGFVWGIHVLRINTHYLTKLKCINITSMTTLPANEQLWNIHHESRSFPRKTNHVLSLKN